MSTITVSLHGKPVNVEKGDKILALCPKKIGPVPFIAAMVNGTLRELGDELTHGDSVTLLDCQSRDGYRIYERGLLFLLVRAAKELFPEARVDIKYALGSGILFELENFSQLTLKHVDMLEARMRELVELDEPFERKIIPRNEAIKNYLEEGEVTVARLLHFRPLDYCRIYKCGGVNAYFYGYMPPSTKYLSRFKLHYMPPGALLVRAQNGGQLDFAPRPKLAAVFEQSDRWASILGCTSVADLNEMVQRGELAEFIRTNEALHEKEIANIADTVCSSGKQVILIAGPSSSGKTTFAQRLSIQLRVNGKRPVAISLDNYYIDRDKIPVGEDGKRDFEHINTLDLPLVNEQLCALLAGKEVMLPKFSFKTGKREPQGRPFTLQQNEILLVEGIHALNDLVSQEVSQSAKFKVYISALTQLNLDNHNRIPTTDVRLLRRIVRDYATRASSAENTLSMWPVVRAGEERWIFPFQENSDAMFNSTLVYELLFLKKCAYSLLKSIDKSSEYYPETNRLIKFLNYFVDPGSDDSIPATSIIREFIGGCPFE